MEHYLIRKVNIKSLCYKDTIEILSDKGEGFVCEELQIIACDENKYINFDINMITVLGEPQFPFRGSEHENDMCSLFFREKKKVCFKGFGSFPGQGLVFNIRGVPENTIIYFKIKGKYCRNEDIGR